MSLHFGDGVSGRWHSCSSIPAAYCIFAILSRTLDDCITTSKHIHNHNTALSQHLHRCNPTQVSPVRDTLPSAPSITDRAQPRRSRRIAGKLFFSKGFSPLGLLVRRR